MISSPDTSSLAPSARRSPYSRAQRIRRWTLFGFALLLVVAISVGSLLPGSLKQVLHTRGRFHAWLHAAAFGALAFATVRGARSSTARMGFFSGTLLFGCCTELFEFLIYHAPFEWHDVLVDALGITAATLLALIL